MQIAMAALEIPAGKASDDDILYSLRLIRSRRVGPTTFHRLLGEHGSVKAALEALPDIAAEAGVKDYEICTEARALEELRHGKLCGATLLLHGDPDYPLYLAETTDAPPALWVMGDQDLLRRPSLALVGARSASSLGLRMAKSLARDLGEDGQVIASGLARGIDSVAHEASLPTGTIAVMPGGVDVVYPKENASLAQEIAEKGLRVSENPPGTVPQTRHFPQRNRIIAGLSHGLVVVEAAAKSGSLITARIAAEQGRDVFAVPAHPFDARASGCNMLIRDGATLVRGASDVLAALGAEIATPAKPDPVADQPPDLGPEEQVKVQKAPPTQRQLERDILAVLGENPISEDMISRHLSKPASQIGPAVIMLETNGQILRLAGGLIARA